jgi:hypothetical protein
MTKVTERIAQVITMDYLFIFYIKNIYLFLIKILANLFMMILFFRFDKNYNH